MSCDSQKDRNLEARRARLRLLLMYTWRSTLLNLKEDSPSKKPSPVVWAE